MYVNSYNASNMNESESAGGGHSGSISVPPAVSDHIKTTATPTSGAIATTQSHENRKLKEQSHSRSSGQVSLLILNPQPPISADATILATKKNNHNDPNLPFLISNNSIENQQQQRQQQSKHLLMSTTPTQFSEEVSPNIATVTNRKVNVTTDRHNQTKQQKVATPVISTEQRTGVDVHLRDYIVGNRSAENVSASLLPGVGCLKLHTSSSVKSAKPGDINNIKKSLLERKRKSLRILKDKHSENVAELYFLQIGSNMMEYQTWRKNSSNSQIATFGNKYSLEKLCTDQKEGTNLTSVPSSQTTASSGIGLKEVFGLSKEQSPLTTSDTDDGGYAKRIRPNEIPLAVPKRHTSSPADNSEIIPPKGAEIKIPSVGATPIALSKKLPPAVAQLTQQGHVPGRPLGGRHGMVFGQIHASSAIGNTSIPLIPGGTPLVPYSSKESTLLCRNGGSIEQILPSPNSPNTSRSLETAQPTTNNLPASAGDASVKSSLNSNFNNGGGAAFGSIISTQEFSHKAKQEVYVMQRISELQREGLWTEKRLPKLQEPPRVKTHWDYLLEEMIWLAADFAQERKWKKAAAKKCSKMVQKYFQDKANAAQKAEKAQEAHLRRTAAFIAKEVKLFWTNVEKLVTYKHQTKIEEKRKQALDQHLSFIVDQTEKFSQQLAEGMNKPAEIAASGMPSTPNSSSVTSPKVKNSDDEFCPESASDDDEETIANAEAEDDNESDVHAEVRALEKESQLDLDEFLRGIPKGYLRNRDKLIQKEQVNNSSLCIENEESLDNDDADDNDDDADLDADDDDNMKTNKLEFMEADELSSSQHERKAKIGSSSKSKDGKRETQGTTTSPSGMARSQIYTTDVSDDNHDNDSEIDSDDTIVDEDDSELETLASTKASLIDSENNTENELSDNEAMEEEEDAGLRTLLQDTDANSRDDIIQDAAALAESLQPKGNTLSSTNVVTAVPFLLKHTLREYQHIGLDWLVTMNERKLNGILADEMGLGKTIQTIALLAHLACEKNNWGPHLIVVPSSVMLNWEMEFKKWCPGFKILTYYGTQKERKLKRVGWTKPNAFHVCITSYKLVIQDQQSFRRKKWKYLILDEAQNIKNFKSQRWQLLLNFSTDRRLLLTGTPLQNDLMELWSLMHFLMPYVFSSHREFKEWFSNPMTGMIEGNMEYNETLINRLHKVIRPFLLRRLKKEVEKQMPKKYEHVLLCRLSNRQRYLYDDFMSHTKTKETLQTGNLISVINILMQLRKVCNHPNMFEVRPTISPFQMETIVFHTPGLVCNIFDYLPLQHINLQFLNLLLVQIELTLTAYVSYKMNLLSAGSKLIEEVDTLHDQLPPQCPKKICRFYVRTRHSQVQQNLRKHTNNTQTRVCVGASPSMRSIGNKLIAITKSGTTTGLLAYGQRRLPSNINPITRKTHSIDDEKQSTELVANLAKEVKTATISAGEQMECDNEKKDENEECTESSYSQCNNNGALTTNSKTATILTNNNHNDRKTQNRKYLNMLRNKRKTMYLARLKLVAAISSRRTEAAPIYGSDCREIFEHCSASTILSKFSSWQTRGYTNCYVAMQRRDDWTLANIIKSYEQRCIDLHSIFTNFIIYVPSVCTTSLPQFYAVHRFNTTQAQKERCIESTLIREISPKLGMLHGIISAMTTQFPDPRLIQYDCGKLQTLDKLLRQLKNEQHRVLIFTQMTRMLDVLETFLNYHGHIYLRLDGTTKVEQRQALMERFNADRRVFCFILSTRSGGVGINLTGADTVIFYDSDWNPTMDAQAQDRCHRIGQTRDVHIYRLVSEKTIEVNIMKKANQKRMLSDMAIEGGKFTTSFFKSSTVKDLFAIDLNENQSTNVDGTTATSCKTTRTADYAAPDSCGGDSMEMTATIEIDSEKQQSLRDYENALAAAEDEQDVQALRMVKAEVVADMAEFDESIPIVEANTDTIPIVQEMSKAEMEIRNIVDQLTPIERYAMRLVEETGAAWTAEQLRIAEEEIEAQKREWEANRLAALKKEEEVLKLDDEKLTYSHKDASNQIWMADNGEIMPIWCPPTPPQDENDIYIDHSLSYMYELKSIPESKLPSVYIKRDYKRMRTDPAIGGSLSMDSNNRRIAKMRREDTIYPPRSLFDRPSAILARLRRDLKNQKARGVFKPNINIPILKPVHMPPKQIPEPENMAEWTIFEDLAIVRVLINLQGLPCNLMLLSPGHTPNWDLVADIVNNMSKTHRTAKQCRWRYEAVIQPREEGKLLESPKKQKKLKSSMKMEYIKGPLRHLRTTTLYAFDNNTSFLKLMRSRFDCVKAAYLKKAPPPKRHFSTPSLTNRKHMEVLQEFGILNYNQPQLPLSIATTKALKMREKQRGQPQQQQQQQQQHQHVTTPGGSAVGVGSVVSTTSTPAATVVVGQQQTIVASGAVAASGNPVVMTLAVQQALTQQQQQQQQQQLQSHHAPATILAVQQQQQQQTTLQEYQIEQLHQIAGNVGGTVSQQQQQQQQTTTILLQHAGNSNLSQNSATGVVSGNLLHTSAVATTGTTQLPAQLLRSSSIGGHSPATGMSIMKAIVASPQQISIHADHQQATGAAGVVSTTATTVQHLQQQQQQQHQLQKSNIGSGKNIIGSPASVSVMLSNQTMSAIGNVATKQQQQQHIVHHTAGCPPQQSPSQQSQQIVSISQHTIPLNSTQVCHIVPTHAVAVQQQQQQQQTVVCTTSTNMPVTTMTGVGGGAVACLNTSTSRVTAQQRIIATQSGGGGAASVQEVLLQQQQQQQQQRSTGNPIPVQLSHTHSSGSNPTIVSMSGHGTTSVGCAINSFPAPAQLRLASMSSSQTGGGGGGVQSITATTAKGIPMSALQQQSAGNKFNATAGASGSAGGGSNLTTTTAAHIQLYRQRQHLKVLQATPVQTSGGIGVGVGGNNTNGSVMHSVGVTAAAAALLNTGGTIIHQSNFIPAGAGSGVATSGGVAIVSSSSSSSSPSSSSVAVVAASSSSSTVIASDVAQQQKLPVSVGGGGGMPTSASMHMTPAIGGQSRGQFILAAAASAATKQAIAARQHIVGEGGDMLLVKRQMIGLPQSQKNTHQQQQQQQQGHIFNAPTAGNNTVLQHSVGGTTQQQQHIPIIGQTHHQQQHPQQQQQQQQMTMQQLSAMVKTSAAAAAAASTGITATSTASLTPGVCNTVNAVCTPSGNNSSNVGNIPTQIPVNMNMSALSQLKPGGQIKVTVSNNSQIRQLHMPQHLPRKINRIPQIAGNGNNGPAGVANVASGGGNTVAASSNSIVGAGTAVTMQQAGQQGGTVIPSGGGANAAIVYPPCSSIVTQQTTPNAAIVKATNSSSQTQLVHIQHTKTLPSSVTVQQIQQVMRNAQPGTTLATAGIVLSKTSMGRVIPVSVATSSQSNQQRQTIQVVSSASTQASPGGNLRAHVSSGQNITATIKVTPAGGGSGTSGNHGQMHASQHVLINTIQQQQQTGMTPQRQRQNPSPVRLHTSSSGNLVAVVQQQNLQFQSQSNVINSSVVASSGISSRAGGSSSATTVAGIGTTTTTQGDSITDGQGGSGSGTSLSAVVNVSAGQQSQQQHQSRALVKKKIMQIRSTDTEQH